MATLDASRREKVVQAIKEYDGRVGEAGRAANALRPGGLR